MKRESAIEKAAAPVVVQLLPDDRFFRKMADINQLIARRAYELFVKSGFQHGYDLDHWLQAEAQFLLPIALEVSDSEQAITVKASLPGYSAKHIEIHVEPQRLFVSGQLEESDDKKAEGIHSEKCLERIFRSLDLPAEIDPKRVKATFSNGELQIELPRVKAGQKIALTTKAAA